MTRADLGVVILTVTVLIMLVLWVRALLEQHKDDLKVHDWQFTDTDEIPTFYEENEDIPNHDRQD